MAYHPLESRSLAKSMLERFCILTVCTLSFIATAANAAAWEEFVERCLGPLESNLSPKTEGMLLIAAHPNFDMWHGSDIGLTVSRASIDLPHCAGGALQSTRHGSGLDDVTPSRRFIADARHHMNEQVAAQTYARIETEGEFPQFVAESLCFTSTRTQSRALFIHITINENGSGTASVASYRCRFLEWG